MAAVFSKLVAFSNRHPVIRGMISYGTIWPTSCIIQQTMAGKRWDDYDWTHAFRFSLYGGLFTAPTLYAWMRFTTVLWPGNTLRTAVTKAVIEQFTYGPAALVCFFFGMSLLEGKTVEQAKSQVEEKFFPTWRVGLCVWPIFQTVNFCYVPEKNRVPVVSAGSLLWCCFLAYMHQLEMKRREKELELSSGKLLEN